MVGEEGQMIYYCILFTILYIRVYFRAQQGHGVHQAPEPERSYERVTEPQTQYVACMVRGADYQKPCTHHGSWAVLPSWRQAHRIGARTEHFSLNVHAYAGKGEIKDGEGVAGA